MIVGVIGGSKATKEVLDIAYNLGKEIALRRYYLICGGMSGVMEAVCKGAKEYGGTTIGILPGRNKTEANQYIDIPIVTAMHHARNAIIVRTADILVAIDGKFGTLSEIALGLACEKRIIGINTWDIKEIVHVNSVAQAIKLVEEYARNNSKS